MQSGGAHSPVPQTSREEHDLLPQHTDTAPVMHTVTSGRDLLDQAKVLAKYLREVSRRMAGRSSSDEECALGYVNGVTAAGCLRPDHGYCLPSLRVKPILSVCIYRKAGRNCWSIRTRCWRKASNHLVAGCAVVRLAGVAETGC